MNETEMAKIEKWLDETHQEALDAFVAEIGKAKAKLDKIGAFVDDHCEIGPDQVTWANVGPVYTINEDLDKVLNFITQIRKFNIGK